MKELSQQSISQPIPAAVVTQGTRRATGLSTVGAAAPRLSGEMLGKATCSGFDVDYNDCILTPAPG